MALSGACANLVVGMSCRDFDLRQVRWRSSIARFVNMNAAIDVELRAADACPRRPSTPAWLGLRVCSASNLAGLDDPAGAWGTRWPWMLRDRRDDPTQRHESSDFTPRLGLGRHSQQSAYLTRSGTETGCHGRCMGARRRRCHNCTGHRLLQARILAAWLKHAAAAIDRRARRLLGAVFAVLPFLPSILLPTTPASL
jgi:hypothetical protein